MRSINFFSSLLSCCWAKEKSGVDTRRRAKKKAFHGMEIRGTCEGLKLVNRQGIARRNVVDRDTRDMCLYPVFYKFGAAFFTCRVADLDHGKFHAEFIGCFDIFWSSHSLDSPQIRTSGRCSWIRVICVFPPTAPGRRSTLETSWFKSPT